MHRSTSRGRRARWAGGATRAIGSLTTFERPPGPRWPLALQAAIALATPVAVGSVLDRLNLGLLAATGAFTALYASGMSTRDRLRVLPLVALGLVLVAALGTALSPSPGWVAFGLIAVTVGASAAALGLRLGPPGPVFFVLTYGFAAHVTSVVDGARGVAPAQLIGAVATGSAFTLLVVAARLVRARNWAVAPRQLRELLPGPELGPEGRELLLRATIVAIVGTLVSVVLVDPQRAYWTVAAAVAVVGMRAGRGAAASRGLHRIVGTLAGAGVYLGLAALDLVPLAFALVLGALQFTVEMVIVRNYALALAFITPLVLLLTGAATGDVGSVTTLAERLIDTAVGATLGVLTGLVHRPRDTTAWGRSQYRGAAPPRASAAVWPRPRAPGILVGGAVSERPKEHASKACVGESPPWVQIPPAPPRKTPGDQGSFCVRAPR